MMLSIPFMCCYYRYILLLTRFQPSQWATALCESVFTRSKDYLCIHPIALVMYVNYKICDLFPDVGYLCIFILLILGFLLGSV